MIENYFDKEMVCYHDLNNPHLLMCTHLLLCGHFMCLKCLLKQNVEIDVILCPTCLSIDFFITIVPTDINTIWSIFNCDKIEIAKASLRFKSDLMINLIKTKGTF